MLFLLVILLFIAAFLVMVFRKQITAIPLSVCIVCIVLLVIHIGSGFLLTLNQESIAVEALDKITEISWDDEEQLHRLGFVNHEGMMAYASTPKQHAPSGMTTFFLIGVEEADDEEIKQMQDLKSHKDILYTEKISYGYANALLEFVHYPETASRSYCFYVDDRLVSVREYNEHNTDRLFEQYVIDLNIVN